MLNHESYLEEKTISDKEPLNLVVVTNLHAGASVSDKHSHPLLQFSLPRRRDQKHILILLCVFRQRERQSVAGCAEVG